MPNDFVLLGQAGFHQATPDLLDGGPFQLVAGRPAHGE
jgi:hypothetical protein